MNHWDIFQLNSDVALFGFSTDYVGVEYLPYLMYSLKRCLHSLPRKSLVKEARYKILK